MQKKSDFIIVNGESNSLTGHEMTFGETGKLKITGNRNKVFVGEGTDLKGLRLEITGDDCEFIIGSKCKIRGFIQIKGIGSSMRIGNKSTATGISVVVIEGKTISIGDDCMLSYQIEMRTSDAHALLDINTRKRINLADNISIGNHVWIGARAVILKGACLPNDVVVAQGSMINKAYLDSHCVLAGTPAKVVKSGVTWDRKLSVGL